MNEGMDEWMDGWASMGELLFFVEVRHLFSQLLLLWAATYLSYFCSQLPPSYLFCSFWKVVPCLSHELKHLPSCDRVRVEEKGKRKANGENKQGDENHPVVPKKSCLPVASSILVGPGRIGKHAAVHASVLGVLAFTCCIWSGWRSSCRCRRGRIFQMLLQLTFSKLSKLQTQQPQPQQPQPQQPQRLRPVASTALSSWLVDLLCWREAASTLAAGFFIAGSSPSGSEVETNSSGESCFLHGQKSEAESEVAQPPLLVCQSHPWEKTAWRLCMG